MSRIAAGHAFNPRHLGLNLGQCGFAPERLAVSVGHEPPEWLSLVSIGSGMAGIDAAVKAVINLSSHQMNQHDEAWAKDHPASINPVNDAIRQQCLAYLEKCFGRAGRPVDA